MPWKIKCSNNVWRDFGLLIVKSFSVKWLNDLEILEFTLEFFNAYITIAIVVNLVEENYKARFEKRYIFIAATRWFVVLETYIAWDFVHFVLWILCTFVTIARCGLQKLPYLRDRMYHWNSTQKVSNTQSAYKKRAQMSDDSIRF